MFVRNAPAQGDADHDGIGDACDNCVALANCEGYGPDNPYELGQPIAFDDQNLCQRDDDDDLVGDECAGQTNEGAAGPVGFGPTDDFDQDGLANASDGCPRQPCGIAGACTHVDSDDDGIGDVCDTCPFQANPLQAMDGEAQEDDPDGDFVGAACETIASCSAQADARPFAFHQYSSNGLCCTVELVEGDGGDLVSVRSGTALRDPDGLPIRVDCADDGVSCRQLPAVVGSTPGMLRPPLGCAEVLGDVAAADNPVVQLDDVGGSIDELAGYMCALPQWDADYDGLGDPCDLCPFAYDPQNVAYVDDEGMAWPEAGKYCNGGYSLEAICDVE
jgi:hypothetical protein